MASSAPLRNGSAAAAAYKAGVKLDRPLNLKSSSFKSRLPPNSAGSAVRRSSPASFASGGFKGDDGVPGRVRVAIRLRPRNPEELAADADFADCVELQPELKLGLCSSIDDFWLVLHPQLKRLKLRKNNWDSDTYEFDEVLTEFASQKRVYEVVAKPVVESVLDGYNGTVMAYGQTGTGKTFTLGRLGEEDTSYRGIMVRSMEDIFENISPGTDSVTVSYLQLYMETIQDLLDPSNDNIPIVEDPRSGDVSVPGATLVEIRDQQSFVELLRLGETHRIAANTKLNTESSRSHAILMVHVKRSVMGREDNLSGDTGEPSHLTKSFKPLVRKSKLVVVDLAGSERIHKSGSEGHMLEEAKSINLSLSALGKCINALAENSTHVPVRDSKLTRLLRDSFGGSARTSLIITIGPSPRHRGETTSTILFGQRAMKVENMLKIKEEFDYKSLSRRLEIELDKHIAENERRQKYFDDEIERIHLEAQNRIGEVEQNFADALEKERLKCQMDYMETVKKLEEKLVLNQQKHECCGLVDGKCNGEGPGHSASEDIAEVQKLLRKEINLRKIAEEEVKNLKIQIGIYTPSEGGGDTEILELRRSLEEETHQKKKLEEEIIVLRSQLLQLSFEATQELDSFVPIMHDSLSLQMRKCLERGAPRNAFNGVDSSMPPFRHFQSKDTQNGDKASYSTLFEQVGLQKILSLFESEDVNVRIHAVKVVANLAAEEANQKRIVEAGGLTSLLMLLRTFEDETIRRVAAGAIANLAMNEANQDLIMAQGGISLLSITAADADEPQTLRMVAGAIANLCGNDKLQTKLKTEGGIKALLGIVRCGHPDVLSQVARGVANFAKCESRASTQGLKNGRSLLIEDGALPWIVQNANNEAAPIRRHIELALCHLAQHEINAKDMISGGALWELVRISRDCSREDIRSLARQILQSTPTFCAEMRRLRIEY
ncbi:Kinesin-like protein [Parasponia andersonii]|uniref:Kinesin-like protein n=1 Tax=Parasponia andersonii TaxID=3476 RepID=A0A2P5AFA8_PARAD|nr:Kinesin-like protein [Parasponia andersonii]